MSKLNLDLRVGESVSFDDGRIEITLSEKSGQRARLEIKAKSDVTIKTNKSSTASALARSGINLNSIQHA